MLKNLLKPKTDKEKKGRKLSAIGLSALGFGATLNFEEIQAPLHELLPEWAFTLIVILKEVSVILGLLATIWGVKEAAEDDEQEK